MRGLSEVKALPEVKAYPEGKLTLRTSVIGIVLDAGNDVDLRLVT